MPLLDTQKILRGLRALMLLGLAWEVLHTVKYPWHSEQQADAYFTPAWRLNAVLGDAGNKSETLDLIHPRQYTEDGVPIYSSTKLLYRCQSAMRYNINSSQYETGPMSVWSSAASIIESDPAAAWATWQEILWTAKNPWGAYWARSIALLSWHIMPTRMIEHLELLEEAVPVLIADPQTPAATAGDTQQQNKTSRGPEGNAINQRGQTAAAAAAAAWWDTAADVELAKAATFAAVNGSAAGDNLSSDGDTAAELDNQTLTDGSNNSSSSSSSSSDADDDDDSYRVVSRWVAHCNAAVNPNTLKPVSTASCTVIERGNNSLIGGHFHVTPSAKQNPAAAVQASEARLFGAGPLGTALQGVIQWLDDGTAGWAGLAVQVAAALWHLAVPIGSIRVLVPLMRYLAIMELEYEWAVLLTYGIVVLAVFKSWLYLICVAYKVLRRLQLLAFHNLRDRFTGTCLTIFGMILGLWQNMGYSMMDLAIDVLLMKFMMSVLEASDHAAFYAWSVSFEWGVFELRALVRCYKLAIGVWADFRNLVMDPQAILLQQPALLEQRKNKVNTIGPWPAPLPIPDAIGDLPNSDVPRGFICPITQSIMRQPALLLHDQTVTPSSYEKEAISEWLSTHSSDPKTPGRQLRMKTVKLVYNGDLARAIEDWVSQTLQRTASQQRQFAFMQQFRVRAQEALFQRQQQQQQGAGAAAQGQADGPDPFAVAAAAAIGAEGALLSAEGPAAAAAAVERGDARNRSSSIGVAGTATNLMRQSSAAIATVASLDIPTVATAGLAALADTTRRITTRAAARRLAQQQQRQHYAAAAGGSSSSDEEQESPLVSPLQSPRAAAGAGAAAAGSAHHMASRSSPDVSPGEGRDCVRCSDSDGDGQAPRRSLRVRQRTATPAVE